MITNPARAIIYTLILAALLIVGLLLFAPRTQAQTPDASTVGNSITVSVDTFEEDDEADFELCLQGPDETRCHVYNDGDTRLFDDLEDGRYELYIDGIEDGWQLRSFRCEPRRHDDLLQRDDSARFGLDGDGDHFVCRIVFEEMEPTPTPTATKTATPQPTATAAPTQAPALETQRVDCDDGSVKFVAVNYVGLACNPAPTSVPAVAPTVAPPVVQQGFGVISPPSTGDAGLLDR